MLGKIEFRVIEGCDDAFVRQVYAHSRDREFAYSLWTAEQKSSFLNSQFDLQDQHYKMSNPSAVFRIITLSDNDIGRLIVDRSGKDMQIIDLQILPAYRGQGIGSSILHALINEAASGRVSAHLHVELNNTDAQKLYRRLGFKQTNVNGHHIAMSWTPTIR